MILKVEVKRLLKEYLRQREGDTTEFSSPVKHFLEDFAEWLDNLDIEKVIGD